MSRCRVRSALFASIFICLYMNKHAHVCEVPFMYVHVYIYIYIYTHLYIYTCTYIWAGNKSQYRCRVQSALYVCMYVCICIDIYIRTHTLMRYALYVCICTCIYTYTHTFIYIRTRTYAQRTQASVVVEYGVPYVYVHV